MTNSQIAELIYQHTGLSEQQFPDEYAGCKALCQAVVEATWSEQEPLAWRVTTIAPEGLKPLTFFFDNQADAEDCQKHFRDSTLTTLFA